jgi:hypothetical protein
MTKKTAKTSTKSTTKKVTTKPKQKPPQKRSPVSKARVAIKAVFKRRRAALIKALLSGDLKQDTGHLHTQNGYCGLGVACAIAREPLGLKTSLQFAFTKPGVYYVMYSHADTDDGVCEDATMTRLPAAVEQYFGFHTEGGDFRDAKGSPVDSPPSLSGKNGASSLIVLNDSNGWTFAEIADLIEKQPGLMFKKGTY